ncbi:MAG: hypothetical protein ABJB66_09000 [Gemmatimonadaceae bacterium]
MESVIGVIGNVVLPYAVLSALAMLLVEFFARVISLRESVLQSAIRHMLADESGEGFAGRIYSHPLIKSLSAPDRKPAYIPARLFATALVDEVHNLAEETNDERNPRASIGGIDSGFARSVRNLVHGELRQALMAQTRNMGNGNEAIVIQKWYDDVMDQASGTYRWKTVQILTCVAFVIVFLTNFDAIRITNHIADRALIERVIEAKTKAIASTDTSTSGALSSNTDQLASLKDLAMPIGWSGEQYSGAWSVMKLIGLLTSVLAVIIGAPFVFDSLNRFMVVRFTVKPYESQ